MDKVKVKVTINYITYVMDDDIGIALFKAFADNKVERLSAKYDDGTRMNIYYTEPISNGQITLSNILPEDYAIWKLAGASLEEKDK